MVESKEAGNELGELKKDQTDEQEVLGTSKELQDDTPKQLQDQTNFLPTKQVVIVFFGLSSVPSLRMRRLADHTKSGSLPRLPRTDDLGNSPVHHYRRSTRRARERMDHHFLLVGQYSSNTDLRVSLSLLLLRSSLSFGIQADKRHLRQTTSLTTLPDRVLYRFTCLCCRA